MSEIPVSDVYAAVHAGTPVAGNDAPSLATLMAVQGAVDALSEETQTHPGEAINTLAEVTRAAQEGEVALICLPLVSEEGARTLINMSEVGVGDHPAVQTARGVHVDVGAGERARFLHTALPDAAHFSVHMLLSVDNPDGVAPILALRLLHGNDAEEVVLTITAAGLVIANQLRVAMQWQSEGRGRPRLLSLHVDDDVMRIDVDGVPLWFGPKRSTGRPTGTNLDLIGVDGGTVSLTIHWFEVFVRSGHLPQHSPINELARARLRNSLAGDDVDQTALDLHAFKALDLPGEHSLLRETRDRIEQLDGPFRSHVFTALTRRISQDSTVAPAVSQEPSRMPVISVDGIDVRVSANAAGDKSLFGLLTGREREKIHILKDVSFDVYPGDIVGIVGKNGAGKTTLLHTIIGAIPISSGQINVQQKPVLLRPGAGMQSELTGRENIFQAGLYMGLSAPEIRDIMDDVIEFSELGKHIDRPYQYYSDGMRARLIFSMATAVSPTILMLDELLSAGDIGFQKKALRRLDSFLENARVVLVVQHGLDFVLSRCTKCLYLRDGQAVYYGDPQIAAELYQGDL